MRMRFSVLVSFLILLVAGAAHAAEWADWTEFHREFTNLSVDSLRVAHVTSLMIERDAGTIVLEEGRLALLRPLGGRTVAATFVGRGTFQFSPRAEIERQQLRRFYDTRTLRRKFQRLTLVFSDTTLAELEAALTFGPDTTRELRRAWLGALPYMTWTRTTYVRPLSLAQMLADRDDNGMFWALMSDAKNADPVFFSLDPSYPERVRLGRKPEVDNAGLKRFYNSETVCQFFALGDVDTLRRDMNPPYSATHYRTDVNVKSNLDLEAMAEVTVRAHDRARGWIGFQMPDDLVLDSLVVAGREVAWKQEKDSWMLWVKVSPPIAANESAAFRFRYHGQGFERGDDWIFHRFMFAWVPQPWSGGEATWDMSFSHPRDLQLIAAGKRVSYDASGLVHRSRWRVEQPMNMVSFDANFMRATHVPSDTLPVTVWMRHLDGAGRVTTATAAALREAKDYDGRVAYDVTQALQFFERAFGPPPSREFHALETPEDVYVAYPGMIHMMLRSDRIEGRVDATPPVLRAHEISHQWFGLGVDNATYHDAWLSEGFADFCSIWYVQAGRRDAKLYLDVLEQWRKDLIENRKFMLGDGQQAGPIWLGSRTNSSSTPYDYSLVIYEKGAWVLHMLRNYLLEDGDPSEARFRTLLRDFYTRFNGRKAFTEDFRVAVERATGEDMGWFFEQWVYGTDVPTYRFTWTAEPAAGGQWRIKGRVEQSHVPESFRMPVFVRVDFGPERFSRQRVWVKGAVTEFELPLAPAKPTTVRFNDLESVLCDIE